MEVVPVTHTYAWWPWRIQAPRRMEKRGRKCRSVCLPYAQVDFCWWFLQSNAYCLKANPFDSQSLEASTCLIIRYSSIEGYIIYFWINIDEIPGNKPTEGLDPKTSSYFNKPTNQPTNQPTNRPTNQPTNHPTNQPTVPFQPPHAFHGIPHPNPDVTWRRQCHFDLVGMGDLDRHRCHLVGAWPLAVSFP